MPSYNRVILVGNLTRSVEVKYLTSGTAVADIGLAVNERVKKNDQWTDEVNFFDIAAGSPGISWRRIKER